MRDRAAHGDVVVRELLARHFARGVNRRAAFVRRDDNQRCWKSSTASPASATRHDELDGVIIASVRTPSTVDSHDLATPDDVEDADIDRWFEMSHLAEQAGIELVEWFVVGRSITCPRDLIGAAPRW